MFNPTTLVIDTFVDALKDNYERVYGLLDAEFAGIIRFVGRIALENIANTDAAYHDLNHTIMVTQVGQEIIRGKHLIEGGVTTKDWMHFVISLLCHDIGYVRGILKGDACGSYVKNLDGETVELDHGATDAALTPYHVHRSRLFVRERFGGNPVIDVNIIEANILNTCFPVPGGEDGGKDKGYPGLVRAADLIGQLADIGYERKQSALFHEFQETGTAEILGFKSPGDLRAAYPKFFWGAVSPYINDTLHYLSVTQDGKQWIANLFAHVFAQEHGAHGLGPLTMMKDNK
ncbi:MAG: metal-dependent phosphohydrolase [Rhodospirillales bacterium RIFCSPLOWO2_02_FULL_58_16]|nr:MAG: metal-dependent phosphohydrolase [Rhodospirillales bacterium RIFCSPLOWO2_02_FULL_58_16]